MQFTTTVVALFLAASSVSAIPSAPLAARQGAPRVRATFYNDGGCNGVWAEDTVFLQDVTGCQAVTVGPFQSTFFNESSITRTLRFYELPGCPDNNGRHLDLEPGAEHEGCYAQEIRSYRVL